MNWNNLEENLKAISIVKEMVESQRNFNDYFYSGDKDTRIEAYDTVLKKHNLSSCNELSNEDNDRYFKEFDTEINEVLGELIEYGKKTEAFLKQVLDLMKTLEINAENHKTPKIFGT